MTDEYLLIYAVNYNKTYGLCLNYFTYMTELIFMFLRGLRDDDF